MKCPGCQCENRDEAKFCNECGHEFQIACPRCEAANRPGSKFCDECGHAVTPSAEAAPKDLSFDEKIAKIQRYLPEGLTEKILSQRERIEGERKQVTVMFCDMEGFTALTERLGPEEAYGTMDQVYEILIHKVHDYEGTVNEMTGDGIVALFGAPIALEDAPQRAIRSAMAIHREMTRFSVSIRKEETGIPPLKMRVGIHSGPVVVGTLGNDLRVDFKAVGDTVNLASRMEDLAEPGTSYVTEDTFKLTEGLFRFEALGAREIKGKDALVNVYQVIAPSTRRTRFDVNAERGLTPFVGRERELEILLDGFERAKEGAGQAFSVVAEAGVGKSRLLYEFRKSVTNEDVTFLEGRSLSYSRGIAYHPVIEILKSIYDIKEDDGATQIREKVKKGIKITGADEPTTMPYLLDLLSAEEKEIESISVTPEAAKERIIEALKAIVLKGSEVRPLIMAFEDLHWVDRSSEDVLKSLMEAIPGVRVFLLFTYRPEYIHSWGGKSYHSQLNLNRLSNRESLAMVKHLLDSRDLNRAVEELILNKTEGVPFFIEEFVKSIRDLRIIERQDDRYHMATGVQEVSIPSTVQDVIMARIDSLPEGAKEALQTGAVIGREFGYELIRRVTDLPQEELLSRLSGLRDSELIYERGIYPQSNYIFKHALTQEVVYKSLLIKRRNELHQKIGQAIVGLYEDRLEEYYELLAYHYVRSDNKGKAVEYLGLANKKAIAASAMENAGTYFEEAMRLLDALPDTDQNRQRRIALLNGQWTVFQILIDLPRYYELLAKHEDIAANLSDRGLSGAFYARLAYCEFSSRCFEKAISISEKAAQLCEATGHDEEAVFAYMVMQWSSLFIGELERTIALRDKMLHKGGKRISPQLHIRTLAASSAAYTWLGRWGEAEADGQDALKVAREVSDNYHISYASQILLQHYVLRGDLERGIKYAEMAVKRAPTNTYQVWAQAFLGWARCRSGQVNQAIESISEALSLFRMVSGSWGEFVLLIILSEAHFEAKQLERARKAAQEAQEITKVCGAKTYNGWAHIVLGEIALETNVEKAAPHLGTAISIFRDLKSESFLARAYSGMGRFHKQQGNAKQAREYLTKALEIFERLGTLLEPEKVRKELVELPATA